MKYLLVCFFFSLAHAKLTYPFVRTGIAKLDTSNYTVVPRNSSFKVKLYADMYEMMKSVGNLDLQDSIFQANINDYMDKVLGNSDRFIKASMYDPSSMPNFHEDMSCNIFWLIPYTGTLDMWDGYLNGASTIVRDGDAIATYDKTTKHFELQVPITFQSLQFSYHFKLDFPWMFTSEGLANGGVTNLHMNIAIGVDCDSGLIDLDDYSIIDSGHISISFHTFSWMPNWTWNLLLNACTAILNGWILSMLQGMVKQILTAAINVLNKIIQAIMNA